MRTSITLPVPEALGDLSWSPSQKWIEQAIDERKTYLAALFDAIGDGQGATAADAENARRLNRELDTLVDSRIDPRPLHGFKGNSPIEQKGPFLSLEQKVAPHFAAGSAKPAYPVDEVRFGALIAAMAGGQHVYQQLNAAELAAFKGTTGPAGGYIIPSLIAGEFIDEVRPLARVFEAGARTLPMHAADVRLPGWDIAPTASWRAEGADFVDGGGTFRAIELHARSVGAVFDVTVEMLEDAVGGFDAVVEIIEETAARAIAQAVDKAALAGKGAENEPLGLRNVSGLNEVSMATNGAIPTDYDKFLDAQFEVESDNFENTAWIFTARTANTLRKIVTGIAADKTKLTPPPDFAKLPRLISNQSGNAETQGSSSVASTGFVGQWDRLVVGFRPEMGVRVLIDPYSKAKSGNVQIVVSQRADVGVLDKGAFSRLIGILA